MDNESSFVAFVDLLSLVHCITGWKSIKTEAYKCGTWTNHTFYLVFCNHNFKTKRFSH